MKAKEHARGYPLPAQNAKNPQIWKGMAEELGFVFRDRSYIHGELDINKGILP